MRKESLQIVAVYFLTHNNDDQISALIAVVSANLDPEILTYLSDDLKNQIIELLGSKISAKAINQLETEDAVQVIENLDNEEINEILGQVSNEKRSEIENQNKNSSKNASGNLVAFIRNEKSIKFISSEHIKQLSNQLSEKINCKVQINYNSLKNRGKLMIDFEDISTLQDLINKLQENNTNK